jgi:hypothetical protein
MDNKMIPVNADDHTLATYVNNIVEAFLDATPEQREFGRQWYPVAHTLALIVGDGDARKGAGIIAALSPNKRWSTNQQLAVDAGTGDVHGHTGAMLSKVRAILGGTDPEEVLPTGMKTWHFFRAILDPDDPTTVVVDRHAHDVAVGERYDDKRDRGLSSKKRYALIMLAYILATRHIAAIIDDVDLTPNVTQATVWGWQIDKNGAK